MKSKEKTIVKNRVKEIKKAIKSEKLKSKTKQERKNQEEQEHKKFNLIYVEYGQSAYKKYVPKRYQERDIVDLLKENRFLELYNRHGEEVFKEYMDSIIKADVEYESGSKLKAIFRQMKYNFCKRYFPTAMAATLMLPLGFSAMGEAVQYNEKVEYAKEIEAYLDDVEEYAEKVKSYELTDLQNIMLVMDDMWENIDGYGEPERDISACLGLDMSESYGVGVCRNMADDVARKLNAINPDYNARSITVYFSTGEYQVANIEQHFVEQEEPDESEDQTEEQTDESGIDLTKYFGNHAVVLMNIPGDHIQLVVDPTNPGIGVLQNGKITLFNAGKENPLKEKMKPLGAVVMGLDSTLEIPYNYINSIGFNDVEELEKRFGLEAQNQALEEVRALNRNEFAESIRYDINKNTATITRIVEDENKSGQENSETHGEKNKEDR